MVEIGHRPTCQSLPVNIYLPCFNVTTTTRHKVSRKLPVSRKNRTRRLQSASRGPKIAIYNRSGCFLPLNKCLRNGETEKTVENVGFGR